MFQPTMFVALVLLGGCAVGADGARAASATLWGSYDTAADSARRELGERRELQDYAPAVVRATSNDILYTGMTSAPAGWVETIGSRCTDTFSYGGSTVTFPDPDVGTAPGYDGGGIMWGAGVAPYDVFATDSAATLSFWWTKLADSVRIGFGDKADIISLGGAVVLKVGSLSPTVGEWYHLAVTKDAGATSEVTVYITSASGQSSLVLGSVTWSSLSAIYLGQSSGAPVYAEMGNIILSSDYADAATASTLYGYGSP